VASNYPDNCIWYAFATDHIVHIARLPSIQPSLSESGDYEAGFGLRPLPSSSVEWECVDRKLTLEVDSPSVFGAATTQAALENLLRELRARGLAPEDDEIDIVLKYKGDTAYFDRTRDEVLAVTGPDQTYAKPRR